jgi:hypothetical protein
LKFQWIIMEDKLKRNYLVCVGSNMRGRFLTECDAD